MPTVLIVDDHPGFRGWARAVLQAEGFGVVGDLRWIAESGWDVGSRCSFWRVSDAMANPGASTASARGE